MTSTSPGGSLAAQLRERRHVARLDDLDDLALDRAADSREPGRLPVDRQLRDGDGGVADSRGGATVGGEPESVRAVELQHVGQKLEALGQLGVRRQLGGHGGDDTRVRLVVCVPTYDERENLEPMVDALGGVFDAHELGRARTGHRRRLARRDGRARRPASRRELRVPGRPPPRPQGGPRAGLRRRLRAGARRRRRARGDHRLRLLARPGRPPRLVAATSRAGIALGSRYVPGGGTRELGRSCAVRQPRRLCVRTHDPRHPVHDTTSGFKSTGGGARGIDPSRIESRGYAFQIETVFRRDQGRVHRRGGADPVRRPHRGRSKMGRGSSSRRSCACPRLRLAAARGRSDAGL